LLGLCFVHILMGLKIAPVILAGSSSLVMIGLYYFVRFRNCLYIPKVILTGLGLLMLDFTWYSKFLSNGPVLFYLVGRSGLIVSLVKAPISSFHYPILLPQVFRLRTSNHKR
jgi:hypothetical protein